MMKYGTHVMKNKTNTDAQDLGDSVKFKGNFLGKLIDAVALLDLAEMVMKGNQEVGLSQSNMTGIIILLEEIKGRLNIEAHLLEE
jgi:hypothetical protein